MKIELDIEKQNALKQFLGNGGAGVEALKGLLDSAIAVLSDVRHIDPKGNVGLQTVASQKALEIVEQVFAYCFPDNVVKSVKKVEEIQPRPYR